MEAAVAVPAEDDRGAPRETWQQRAFRLVHDLQADVPRALAELDELCAEADALGWHEVARTRWVGRAVRCWQTRRPGAPAAVAALIDDSTAGEDDVMLALGLGMRADEGFSGHDPSAAAARDADLARAVVLLERAGQRPVERIAAHTAVAIALANRSLFELAREQHQSALALGPIAPPEAIDFLLAPVVFNLAEAELCWAAMLRQLGDHDGVVERLHAWRAAEAETTAYDMASGWRSELAAMGLLLRAVAGEDVAEEAARRLGAELDGAGDDQRRAAMLQLAVALSDAGVGRPSAAETTEAAIELLDPSAQTHLFDLATYLAAEIESRCPGHAAGMRYARRQFEHHWERRLSALGSMQSLIRAERQASELELLSRHARLDDLTGVGNRRALTEYLAELERSETQQVALMLLDVDNFKVVNDCYGHLAGDAVLVGVARSLAREIRSSDTVVRLGGDEFAVVLAGADLKTGFERAVELLRAVDEQRFDEASPGLSATLSAGVAAGTASSMRELWSEADLALYQAKAGAGERIVRSRLAAFDTEENLGHPLLSSSAVTPVPLASVALPHDALAPQRLPG